MIFEGQSRNDQLKDVEELFENICLTIIVLLDLDVEAHYNYNRYSKGSALIHLIINSRCRSLVLLLKFGYYVIRHSVCLYLSPFLNSV